MTIREIIDLARITTLGSYALKDDDNVVIQLLNFSLTQVYSKIPALTQIQHLHLVCEKTRYEYLDDGYKVLSAVTGCERWLAVNDDTDPLAIFDMGNHVLDIPMCVQELTSDVLLLLQMRPPKVTCDNVDTIDFTPDDALVPSILSYMAYMVSKNISEANGVGFLQEFMQSIDEVKKLGLYTTYNHSLRLPFYKNGWV
jgi:hypothetical protein